jgi:hypothetical protein
MTVSDWRPVKENHRSILEDFLTMYNETPEQVLVSESVANSLDADSTQIDIMVNDSTFVILDNGAGMDEASFRENYPGLARSTKKKGEGIGFAGVGGKLYLPRLEPEKSIYAETKSSDFHGALELRLIQNELRQRDVLVQNKITRKTGTFVEVPLSRSSALDQNGVMQILQKNYNTILMGLYGNKVITSNGKKVPPVIIKATNQKKVSFEVAGEKCFACFFITEEDMEEENQGLSIIVKGKRIRDSEWFYQQWNIKSEYSRKISGFVCADVLATLLTTDKRNLQTQGRRLWFAFRNKMAAEFKSWLETNGLVRPNAPAKSEGLLVSSEVANWVNSMLKMQDFKDFNPFLNKAVQQVAVKSEEGDQFVKESAASQQVEGDRIGQGEGNGIQTEGKDPGKGATSSDDGSQIGEVKPRLSRSGIKIGFREVPESDQEAWMTDDAIIINSGHPVHKRFVREGFTHETMNTFRCVISLLITNKEPASKTAFDQMSKFYKSWATMTFNN